MVERVPLSGGGPTLSRICYGTWRLLREPTPPTAGQLAERLNAAADLGITTIDTAEIYGAYGVEELIGTAFARSKTLRPRLEIITKFGIYVPNPRHPERRVPFYNASAKRVTSSVDKSLRLLGTDYVDLLLVHRYDWLASADETAEGLAEVVRAGKVRHVGVSNYNVQQVELLRDRLPVPLVTNQVELSLFSPGALHDGTLDQAQRHRFRPMAWSPLGGGRLFLEEDEAAMRVRDVMTELAPKYNNASPTELALAWVLAHPSGPVVAVGTSQIDRLALMAQATTIKLERHDWYELYQAATGFRIP
jgi:predicted oxidoreductase